MIISHKHKFIFVKTRKTAGTSIEMFLADVCGKEDVLVPFHPLGPKFTFEGKKYYRTDKDEMIPVGCDENGARFRNYEKQKFRTHMHAKEIKPRVPESVWNNYFKFCVERNPWDKTISMYYWKKGAENYTPTLEAFIKEGGGSIPNDFRFYTDKNNQLMVDRVLRYESLDEELNEVFGQLGVPFDGVLKERGNSKYRPDKRHYREVLSPEMAKLIRKKFHREIDMFGYTY